MTDHEGCSCPPMRELIAAAFATDDAPPCAVHRPAIEPSGVIALNDDAALTARLIGATTRTKEL